MGIDLPGNGAGAVTDSGLTIPNQGSICMWIRPANLGGTQRICGIADDFEGRFSGNTLFNDWGAGGGVDEDFGTFSNGVLNHIVGTWDFSSSAGSCYKDGVLVDSGNDRNGATNGIMAFGSRGSGGQDPFEGELYDIRIYNRVLTAAEAQTIFAARGLDGIAHGLIHRWIMDEAASGNSISTLKDQGANQIDASPGSGTTPTYVDLAELGYRRRLV